MLVSYGWKTNATILGISYGVRAMCRRRPRARYLVPTAIVMYYNGLIGENAPELRLGDPSVRPEVGIFFTGRTWPTPKAVA